MKYDYIWKRLAREESDDFEFLVWGKDKHEKKPSLHVCRGYSMRGDICDLITGEKIECSQWCNFPEYEDDFLVMVYKIKNGESAWKRGCLGKTALCLVRNPMNREEIIPCICDKDFYEVQTGFKMEVLCCTELPQLIEYNDCKVVGPSDPDFMEFIEKLLGF